MSDAEQPSLRRANDNPWYCLATLYGEQPPDYFDDELAGKNRDAWNQWLGDMPEGRRRELVTHFDRRSGGSMMAPEKTASPDFSRTRFDQRVDFAGFQFPWLTTFHGSIFSKTAIFKKAFFNDANFTSVKFLLDVDFTSSHLNGSDFQSATFSEYADFEAATFAGVCHFPSVVFSGTADFEAAQFQHGAYFSAVTFFEDADFVATTFSGMAKFEEARFSKSILFVNAKFSANTIFANARFESRVPDFRGATMHEATEWHGVVWPQPTRNVADAQNQVYAYERLKQEMERLKKHEDEQSFFRRELRVRRGLARVLSGSWLLNLAYEAFSAYGMSVSRPLFWLFGAFLAGAAIFARAPLYCGAPMPTKLAAKLSFANLFLFLPDKREIMMNPKMVECLSNSTQAISAVQSLFGAVLLFLFGLALRNRFRMK